MKYFNRLGLRISTLLIIFGLFIPTFSYSSINGITGRTLKTRTTGCSCHGSSATPGVLVTITGPDTVYLNQVTAFSLTITGGPASGSGSGCDIATRYGTLSVVSSTLKLSGSELTHKDSTTKTSGSVTFQFNYVYTGAQTIDTLFAIGLSTNSNGGTSGDQWNWATSKRLVIKNATGVRNENQIPSEFILDQNYPNPFNPVTSIRYSIPKSSLVTLKVYDISGKEIVSLVNESLQAGEHTIQWDSQGSPSGIYMYKITAGNFTETKKMILLK